MRAADGIRSRLDAESGLVESQGKVLARDPGE